MDVYIYDGLMKVVPDPEYILYRKLRRVVDRIKESEKEIKSVFDENIKLMSELKKDFYFEAMGRDKISNKDEDYEELNKKLDEYNALYDELDDLYDEASEDIDECRKIMNKNNIKVLDPKLFSRDIDESVKKIDYYCSHYKDVISDIEKDGELLEKKKVKEQLKKVKNEISRLKESGKNIKSMQKILISSTAKKGRKQLFIGPDAKDLDIVTSIESEILKIEDNITSLNYEGESLLTRAYGDPDLVDKILNFILN